MSATIDFTKLQALLQAHPELLTQITTVPEEPQVVETPLGETAAPAVPGPKEEVVKARDFAYEVMVDDAIVYQNGNYVTLMDVEMDQNVGGQKLTVSFQPALLLEDGKKRIIGAMASFAYDTGFWEIVALGEKSTVRSESICPLIAEILKHLAKDDWIHGDFIGDCDVITNHKTFGRIILNPVLVYQALFRNPAFNGTCQRQLALEDWCVTNDDIEIAMTPCCENHNERVFIFVMKSCLKDLEKLIHNPASLDGLKMTCFDKDIQLTCCHQDGDWCLLVNDQGVVMYYLDVDDAVYLNKNLQKAMIRGLMSD